MGGPSIGRSRGRTDGMTFAKRFHQSIHRLRRGSLSEGWKRKEREREEWENNFGAKGARLEYLGARAFSFVDTTTNR